MEWIGDLHFNGVETVDCIAICKREIRGCTQRRGDTSSGAVGRMSKQCQRSSKCTVYTATNSASNGGCQMSVQGGEWRVHTRERHTQVLSGCEQSASCLSVLGEEEGGSSTIVKI